MNKIFHLLTFVLFIPFNSPAQSVERSLSAGYSTETDLVKPYGDDKWLIAGRGDPEPGGYFSDTLFVAVIGHDGQIYWRKNLSLPPSEVHYWHDLLALPDGGILASFESTLCDVGADILSIQRLDAQGNLLWEKNGGFVFGTARPPESWFIAPDGDLLGAGFDEIWKVNVLTGDLLWKADLQGVNGGMISPYEFAIVSGTEDFFAIGNPDFQHWEKAGSPNAPLYILEASTELPGYRTGLTPGLNGTFYCWQRFPDNQMERIDLNLQLEILPIQLVSYGDKSITIGNNGLYLAESSSGTHRFTKFDFQGQNPVNLHASDYWLSPLAVAAHNGWVAVAGQDGSGMPLWSSYHSTCGGAWLRTFPEDNPFSAAETPNANVSEIDQQGLIDTASFANFPIGSLYNLSGGNFQLKIANSGNVTIDNVCVNVTFDFNEFYDICPNKPSRQKRFSNLNLAPGESKWVTFGDIQAMGQSSVPTEICFWTSSPNEQPDAVHEDDKACHPASYTVGLKNPVFEPITLYPNPADQFVDLTFTENMEGERWQILDATGQIADTGTCSSAQTLRLKTASLPNGFYLLNLKNQVGKLVIQH